MADYRPTRRQRESRAFTMLAAAGGSGVATAVTFLLALVSSFSWGVVFLFAILTGVFGMLFKRATS